MKNFLCMKRGRRKKFIKISKMSDVQNNCGFISLLYSIGEKPLSLWSKYVSPEGKIRRITDEDLISDRVVEIIGPLDDSLPTNITCPSNPMEVLSIRLPVLVLIIKNLGLKLKLEFQILDTKKFKRKFTFTTYESISNINPASVRLPLKLEDNWNNLEINFQTLCQDIFGTDYEVLRRIIIYPNCRLRRVYLQDRHYEQEETPVELCQAFFDMYMLKWGIHFVDRSCQTDKSVTESSKPIILAEDLSKSISSVVPKSSVALYNVLKQREKKILSCISMVDKDRQLVKEKYNLKPVDEFDLKKMKKKKTKRVNNSIKKESKDEMKNEGEIEKEKRINNQNDKVLKDKNEDRAEEMKKTKASNNHIQKKSKSKQENQQKGVNEIKKSDHHTNKELLKDKQGNEREMKKIKKIKDYIKRESKIIAENEQEEIKKKTKKLSNNIEILPKCKSNNEQEMRKTMKSKNYAKGGLKEKLENKSREGMKKVKIISDSIKKENKEKPGNGVEALEKKKKVNNYVKGEKSEDIKREEVKVTKEISDRIGKESKDESGDEKKEKDDNHIKSESKDKSKTKRFNSNDSSSSVYFDKTPVPPPKMFTSSPHFKNSEYLHSLGNEFLKKLDDEGNIFSKWPYKFDIFKSEMMNVSSLKKYESDSNEVKQNIESDTIIPPRNFLIKKPEVQKQGISKMENIVSEVERVKDQLIKHENVVFESSKNVSSSEEMTVPSYVDLEAKSSERKSKSKFLTTDEMVDSFLNSRLLANKKIFERLKERGLTMPEVELSIYNSKNRRNSYGQGKLIESCKRFMSKATNSEVIESSEMNNDTQNEINNDEENIKSDEWDKVPFRPQNNLMVGELKTRLLTASEREYTNDKFMKPVSKVRSASVDYIWKCRENIK